MKKLLLIELVIFLTCNAVIGLFTDNFLKGWSVDLAYGALAFYPLYLTYKTPNFGPILATFILWLLGRFFQFASVETIFTYSIASMGLLAIYHTWQDNYGCVKIAGLAIGMGILYAALKPSGILQYLFQFGWNLLYVALLIGPADGKEKGDCYRYRIETFKKAA